MFYLNVWVSQIPLCSPKIPQNAYTIHTICVIWWQKVFKKSNFPHLCSHLDTKLVIRCDKKAIDKIHCAINIQFILNKI